MKLKLKRYLFVGRTYTQSIFKKQIFYSIKSKAFCRAVSVLQKHLILHLNIFLLRILIQISYFFVKKMKSLTLFYLFETLMRKILKLRKIENQKKEDCDTIPGLIKTFQDRIVGQQVSVRICRSDMEPSHPSSPTRLR